MSNEKKDYVAPERIVSPKGSASYPHLVTPDEYEGKKEFKTSLVLDPSEPNVQDYLDDIEARCEAALEAGKAKWTEQLGSAKGKALVALKDAIATATVKLPFEPEISDAGEETGRFVVKYKALAGGIVKYGKNKGEEWSRTIPLFDTQRNPVEPKGLKLWAGSKLRVQSEVIPYAMEGLKIAGISMRLYSVQIIELSSGTGKSSASADGFGVEEGFEAPQAASGNDFVAPETVVDGTVEDDF